MVGGVSSGVRRSIIVHGPPENVFAYLHDPAQRGHWDAMSDLVRLEADHPAAGVRMHFRGRRTAPSWVGELAEYDPPRRSVVRLVEGAGMPFSDFRQTITVEPAADGSRVDFAIDYAPRGLMRLLEAVTVRPKMARAAARSLRAVSNHFS
jgi:uncharacterized protein YndB with AHSA1/START domain